MAYAPPPEHRARLLELAAPLGLTEKTLELLELLPVVFVAWSDGEIQAEEMQVLLEHVEELSLQHPESLDVLEGWLAERPREKFFGDGLKVLSYLLASLPDGELEGATADVLALSNSIAMASGGMETHSMRVEPAEHLALRRVTQRLDLASRPATRSALRKIFLSAAGPAD